jgi:uncharacterized protein YyaL (SSP411 family)
MNRLSKAKSAYLKHAATQKIDWYPWTEEAFEKAKEQDKPIFLSSGAVWCHWCHVMAKESFYHDKIASILNEKFISIKLDRDERPDIDRRYQMSVSLMGSGGGWPLSVFMTYDKRPFYGGTYFPPDDRQGRPGFKKVLLAVDELYKNKKGEIVEYSDKLMEALKTAPAAKGEISDSLYDDITKSIASNYDSQNGGFGTEPKFPMFGAMEFLIEKYYLEHDKKTEEMIHKSLESMACGGFYDQIRGGFHRYSTDKAWIIPHFEKMADDNAWLLRNYLNAYAVTGNDFLREIAEGTVSFIKEVLLDPLGGFYASQDADVTPDDEGGYFTWTDSDFKKVLDEDEYSILSLYLLHESGSMHHDTSKKVLFVSMGAIEIAEQSGRTIEEVMEIVKRGKEKLLVERNRRETPFTDKTLYTSINGMMISVLILAGRVLKDENLKVLALKSLDRILEMRFINGVLFHTEEVKALLDDYIHLVDALLSAYEVTGDRSYFDRADDIMNICISRLWDDKTGGFFDSEESLLDINIKGIEDVPHPSANALAVKTLLKFYSMSGREDYHRFATMILELFIEQVKLTGIHSGYYFCALNNYFNMLKLTINASPDSELARAAADIYSPFVHIVYGEDRGHIIPCIKDTCFAPVDTPEGLLRFFREQGLPIN